MLAACMNSDLTLVQLLLGLKVPVRKCHIKEATSSSETTQVLIHLLKHSGVTRDDIEVHQDAGVKNLTQLVVSGLFGAEERRLIYRNGKAICLQKICACAIRSALIANMEGNFHSLDFDRLGLPAALSTYVRMPYGDIELLRLISLLPYEQVQRVKEMKMYFSGV